MDINRVIMESIQNVINDKEEVIEEKTAFGKEDIVEKGKKLIKPPEGSAFNPKPEDSSVPNFVPSPGKEAENYLPADSSLGGKLSQGAKSLIKTIKENPGAAAGGTAAAIAAGLGALALAKKMRAVKKGKKVPAKA